jgi:hypothetical protein
VSEVSEFLQQMLREKAEKDKRSKGKEQRFTVAMSEYDYRRLRFIASELGEVRGAFVRNLLIQALNDAERALGLEGWTVDEAASIEHHETMYEKTYYGRYINGDIEMDDESEEDESPQQPPKRKRPSALDDFI